MGEPDYYVLMGLDRGASAEQVRKTYRKLALKYHPDKPEGSDDKFKLLNKAYTTLSSPAQRKTYDVLHPATRTQPSEPNSSSASASSSSRSSYRQYHHTYTFDQAFPGRSAGFDFLPRQSWFSYHSFGEPFSTQWGHPRNQSRSQTSNHAPSADPFESANPSHGYRSPRYRATRSRGWDPESNIYSHASPHHAFPHHAGPHGANESRGKGSNGSNGTSYRAEHNTDRSDEDPHQAEEHGYSGTFTSFKWSRARTRPANVFENAQTTDTNGTAGTVPANAEFVDLTHDQHDEDKQKTKRTRPAQFVSPDGSGSDSDDVLEVHGNSFDSGNATSSDSPLRETRIPTPVPDPEMRFDETPASPKRKIATPTETPSKRQKASKPGDQYANLRAAFTKAPPFTQTDGDFNMDAMFDLMGERPPKRSQDRTRASPFRTGRTDTLFSAVNSQVPKTFVPNTAQPNQAAQNAQSPYDFKAPASILMLDAPVVPIVPDLNKLDDTAVLLRFEKELDQYLVQWADYSALLATYIAERQLADAGCGSRGFYDASLHQDYFLALQQDVKVRSLWNSATQAHMALLQQVADLKRRLQ